MTYARAYTYSTSNPDYRGTEYACSMQATDQWLALCTLLYKLNITVLY